MTVSSSTASSTAGTTTTNDNNHDHTDSLEILVLYGSQTGNAAQAANDFAHQVPHRLSCSSATGDTKTTTTTTTTTAKVTVMALDDFLEVRRAEWQPVVVIFTSSYGIGQAPLGCYRFRELCDFWLSQQRSHVNNNVHNKILDGLYYVMCGLGDSKYRTYFHNPTVIDEALQCVGAQRIGPLGQADASGTGNQEQQAVIADWIEAIWEPLGQLIQDRSRLANKQQLATMRQRTVDLCQQINPDFTALQQQQQQSFKNPPGDGSPLQPIFVVVCALVAAMVAVVVTYAWTMQS